MRRCAAMSKIGEGKTEDIIKDNMLKIIKGSEAIALQAVDSATEVLKEGLTNAEVLGTKASDIMLNTARRTISAGNALGDDVREATKNAIKGTIRAASEIGDEVKGIVSAASGKPKEEAKSE
jgi:hypothetical protein